jgi:uncharacterized membrane protein YcaP (DUF421 family)
MEKNFLRIINTVIVLLKTVYRISVMYFVSIVLMRLAGKREVTQLEVSELVTSFMVSEIACMPITDPEVPLVDAVVFSLVVIVLEILLTRLSLKTPIFKHLVIGKPGFLIVNGKLDKTELSKSGVSLSELVSAMRSNGITSLDKINYAIQEPDGNISVIAYKELPGREVEENKNGLQHMLICDGRLNKTEMKKFGYSERDVEKILLDEKIKDIKDVFYLGVDDGGGVFVIEK